MSLRRNCKTDPSFSVTTTLLCTVKLYCANSIACKVCAISLGRGRGRKARKENEDLFPNPLLFLPFVPIPSPFNARYAGLNPTTQLYSWTPYLLQQARMPLSFTLLFLDLEWNNSAIKDMFIKRILATKYFRITHYNSALLQLIIYLFLSSAGRAKSSNKISRLVIK